MRTTLLDEFCEYLAAIHRNRGHVCTECGTRWPCRTVRAMTINWPATERLLQVDQQMVILDAVIVE